MLGNRVITELKTYFFGRVFWSLKMDQISIIDQVQKYKKQRTKNFSEAEKMLLIELVQERRKLLENKLTNNVSVKEKEDCWKDLQINFMSRSKGTVRTVQALKTCWENIKKRTKKQYAEEKQEVYKTGGGQYKAINDPIAEQVREIIRPAVEGLSNICDSDCISGFEDTVDKNETFVEEWLDVTDDSVTERDEDDIERNKSGTEDESIKERNESDMKDNDEFDKENDVLFNFLQKDKLNWKNWNPQKLQTPISIPLRTSVKKKSAAFVEHLASTSSQKKKLKENDFVSSALKETVSKTNNRLKHISNNNRNTRLVKFDTLADCKLELVNLLMDNGKEKHEFETEILKTQLQKEKVQLEIMQKELELKTLILEREQQRFINTS